MLITELQSVSLVYLAHFKRTGGRTFDSLGLTYGQAMVLIAIYKGKTTPNELCDLLGFTRPAMSALITHLTQAGLIERKNIKSDARRVTIKLTVEGIKTCYEIKQAWHENFPVDLQRLSNEELRRLVEAVQILDKHGLG